MEAWKCVSDMEDLRCKTRSQTLCGFDALYAISMKTSLWDDFWQTFQCATNFRVCFFVTESVRQTLSDKVRLQLAKVLLFSDKGCSCTEDGIVS